MYLSGKPFRLRTYQNTELEKGSQHEPVILFIQNVMGLPSDTSHRVFFIPLTD